MIKTFNDLKVYQKSYKLALKVHRITHTFPHTEKYELGSQLRRAAVSIPANIAEGYGNTNKEFKRYLKIANGSSNEVRVYIEMSYDLEYIKEIRDQLRDEYEILSKQIYSLKAKWS